MTALVGHTKQATTRRPASDRRRMRAKPTSSLTIVLLVIKLLHIQLRNAVGGSRQALGIESLVACLIAAGYATVFRTTVGTSSDLIGAPKGLLFSYVVITIVSSATVIVGGVIALFGPARSSLQVAATPLPLEQGKLRLALLVVPLALSFILSSLPALALTSVYISSFTAISLTVKVTLLCLALLVLTNVLLLATATISALTVPLSHLRLSSISTLLSGIIVSGSTLVAAGQLSVRLVEKRPVWVDSAGDLPTIAFAPLILLLCSAAMLPPMLRITTVALSMQSAAETPTSPTLGSGVNAKQLVPLEILQIVRSPGVYSTVVLVAIALISTVAGGPLLLNIPATGSLGAAALFLIPLSSVFAYSATSRHHWTYRATGTRAAPWAASKVTAQAALTAIGTLAVTSVCIIFQNGVTLNDVGEGVPFMVLTTVCALWVGLLMNPSSEDPTAGLLAYMAAMGATMGLGMMLIRSGLFESRSMLLLAIGALALSLVLFGLVGQRRENRQISSVE